MIVVPAFVGKEGLKRVGAVVLGDVELRPASLAEGLQLYDVSVLQHLEEMKFIEPLVPQTAATFLDVLRECGTDQMDENLFVFAEGAVLCDCPSTAGLLLVLV